MYLKRLELFGFKSFASKTTLEFPGGVTAIVGPNGSGKSNVIDALRWILGETSAKNIRAEKSENLIYSGTLQRARSSFAEVKITFDNSTHFFPVDYAEITIRRRVTRDGTSQYFINEGEVRMRDIVDFFSKVRMGTKGFAIVNQGNADLFIKASPIERRVMIEEVLGLRQYQIKRHEAENKLETTKINLDKATALVGELLPSLRILRRQADRFEKHDHVKVELEQFERIYFGAKLFEIAVEEGKITPQIALLDAQLAGKTKELNSLREELASVEKRQPTAGDSDNRYDEFKKKQTELLNRRSQIQKELGRLEAEVEFLVSRPKATVKEAELLSIVKVTKVSITTALKAEDIAAVKKLLRELEHKIEAVLDAGNTDIQSKHKELVAVKDRLISELEQLEKNLAGLGNLETRLAADMREFNFIFKKAFEEVQAKQNEINTLENQKSRLNFEKEKVAMRRGELEHQTQQSGRSLNEFTAQEAKGVSLAELERKMLRLRGELSAIGDIDPAMIEQAKQMEQRYVFLETQIADLKKAGKDLKQLITDLKKKLHEEFSSSLHKVNEEFNNYFRLMFSGGKAKLHLERKQRTIEELEDDRGIGGTGKEVEVKGIVPDQTEEEQQREAGLEIELSIPRKNIKGLDLLSGGERSLVSIAVLFALIAVSPPPFLVLDEVDAALDENNTKRFANLVENFGGKTQFVIVTHNRATMSAASVLYGVTMAGDGTSKLLSIKMEEAEEIVSKV